MILHLFLAISIQLKYFNFNFIFHTHIMWLEKLEFYNIFYTVTNIFLVNIFIITLRYLFKNYLKYLSFSSL